VAKKTHIDFALLVCSGSLAGGDVHNPFSSKSLQNESLFGLTVQSGREVMVGLGDGDAVEPRDYL